MNPEQLLQHFDRISEAPDAIPRLRRFILDLAVRGKLVDQDPNDEPAAELLKRIQVEKDRLGLTPRRKGAKKNEKADQETLGDLAAWREMPFLIPSNWDWSQLAEIGIISPRNAALDDLLASFVPMPMISADYGVPNQHQIRPWDEIKSGYTHFAEGDVGLAKITPCFENSKSTVFRGLTGGIGAGTTELHIVRPIFVNADYVLIFLKCPHFIESGIPKMTGTAGQKRVPTEYFSRSPFPLPPLAEQHRIVAKVDELMALCDQLQAAQTEREQSRDRLVAASLHRIGNITQSRHSGKDCRTNPPGADLHPPEGCRAGQPGMNPEHRDVNLSDAPLLRFGSEHQSAEVMEAKLVYVPVNWIPAIPRQSLTGAGSAGMTVTDSTAFILQLLPRITTCPAHIKQLRQTILNLAVRGKLVPQDPNDEPATKLLKRIQVEKERLVNGGTKKNKTALPNVDLEQAPFVLPLGWSWARFPEIGTFGRGKSKHRPRNDSVLFDGGTHLLVQTGDVARSQGVIQTYTNKYNDVGLAQSMKWPAGTLCITIAANIADSGILSFDACFPDSVVGFVPASMFKNARYFEYFVRTAKASLLEFAPATAQKNINLEILSSVLIPLPPLSEQERIVAKVDELMEVCDQMETQLTTNKVDSRRLLEAVLHEALLPALGKVA